MGDKTAITWTDATWNPVTGCTPVSEGCRNCYAKRVHERFNKTPFSEVVCHPERLAAPLRWKRPRRIFTVSMGDLFHPDVPDEFIDRVFAVMTLCPQHTFQVLTKRAERMHLYLCNARLSCNVVAASNRTAMGEECTAHSPILATLASISRSFPHRLPVPPPNTWLGVTCENQAAADERIPLLLKTPAAVRFVSMEPMLGPVDIERYMLSDYDKAAHNSQMTGNECRTNKLDWVIVGGESGPGARPCHPDWVRSIRDQCVARNVPFHFKQWGDAVEYGCALDGHPWKEAGWSPAAKRHGNTLDGKQWLEFPGDTVEMRREQK